MHATKQSPCWKSRKRNRVVQYSDIVITTTLPHATAVDASRLIALLIVVCLFHVSLLQYSVCAKCSIAFLLRVLLLQQRMPIIMINNQILKAPPKNNMRDDKVSGTAYKL